MAKKNKTKAIVEEEDLLDGTTDEVETEEEALNEEEITAEADEALEDEVLEEESDELEEEDAAPEKEVTPVRKPRAKAQVKSTTMRIMDYYQKPVSDRDAESMRLALLEQPEIRAYVPLGLNEKRTAEAIFPVTLNGFRVDIPKGVYVIVPEGIMAVIQDSFDQTSRAGEEFSTDRIHDVYGEPVSKYLNQ